MAYYGCKNGENNFKKKKKNHLYYATTFTCRAEVARDLGAGRQAPRFSPKINKNKNFTSKFLFFFSFACQIFFFNLASQNCKSWLNPVIP
jgi:hypothetical protein